MIKEFILPDIGEGVVECELIEWLVSEGDTVVEDQPIADVMTDKALVQIPAPDAGVIKKLHYKKGDIAKVHKPLYQVLVSDVEPAEQSMTIANQASDKNNSQQSGAKKIESSSTVNAIDEDFLLPDIGEGIVECEIIEWLVAEGDMVDEDQPIADVMTDKALVQIPAIKAGQIAKLYYKKGELAQVGKPLFSITGKTFINDNDARSSELLPTAGIDIKTDNVDTDIQQKVEKEQQIKPLSSTSSSSKIALGKALASPAVRRVARSLNINLAEVSGSGKNGRIYKEDIENHAQRLLNTNNDLSNVLPSTPVVPSLLDDADERVEAIVGVQAAMAKQMTESIATIPHFTYCEEIDLTELIELRQQLKERYSNEQLKLTMMPFFIKSLSLAINSFPILNSRVNDNCTQLTYLKQHNVGMAVDSKIGLLVPNIKSTQDKSILEIAAEVTRLTTAAREGRVAPSDLQGGTISISNIGALGGTVAKPIINKPEVAIVVLGKVQVLPRFNAEGEVVARKIMQVSWSGDHRVIDGGTIARFCNLWKRYLENPQEMLVNLK